MKKIGEFNCYTIKEAARLCKKSRDTLAKWRCMRNKGIDAGPRFLKVGQEVFYPDIYVDEYLASIVILSK